MKSERALKFRYHLHRFSAKKKGVKPLSFFDFKYRYACYKLTLKQILLDRLDFFYPNSCALTMILDHSSARSDISILLDKYGDLQKKKSRMSPLFLKLCRCIEENHKFFSELTEDWLKDFLRGLFGLPPPIIRTSPEQIKVLLGSYIL